MDLGTPGASKPSRQVPRHTSLDTVVNHCPAAFQNLFLRLSLALQLQIQQLPELLRLLPFADLAGGQDAAMTIKTAQECSFPSIHKQGGMKDQRPRVQLLRLMRNMGKLTGVKSTRPRAGGGRRRGPPSLRHWSLSEWPHLQQSQTRPGARPPQPWDPHSEQYVVWRQPSG